MNINFEYYKVFYIIAKNQNITKGANELNISQPAVSRVIKTLEEQIGSKLFIRGKNGVALTNEGKELYNQISESIENIIKSENNFKKLIDKKYIKICADNTILNYYIIPKLGKSFINNKNIIFLNIDSFNSLNNKLLNDVIDCAIITQNDHFQFSKELKFIELTKIHGCFVTSNDDLTNINLSKDNLSNLYFILQEKNSGIRNYVDSYCIENNIKINPNIIVSNYESSLKLIEKNLGIGVVIEEFSKDKLQNKSLYKIDLDKNMPYISIGIICKNDKQLSLSIQEIIKLLK